MVKKEARMSEIPMLQELRGCQKKTTPKCNVLIPDASNSSDQKSVEGAQSSSQ
jgi:hypothetical protein